MLPEARLELVSFDIATVNVLDAGTAAGIAVLGFAENFPFGVGSPPCRAIAQEAHAAKLAGVASRSSAEATATAFVGEELAVVEELSVGPPQARSKFLEWYPDPIPG